MLADGIPQRLNRELLRLEREELKLDPRQEWKDLDRAYGEAKSTTAEGRPTRPGGDADPESNHENGASPASPASTCAHKQAKPNV